MKSLVFNIGPKIVFGSFDDLCVSIVLWVATYSFFSTVKWMVTLFLYLSAITWKRKWDSTHFIFGTTWRWVVSCTVRGETVRTTRQETGPVRTCCISSCSPGRNLNVLYGCINEDRYSSCVSWKQLTGLFPWWPAGYLEYIFIKFTVDIKQCFSLSAVTGITLTLTSEELLSEGVLCNFGHKNPTTTESRPTICLPRDVGH
jgi:hypothetical protein